MEIISRFTILYTFQVYSTVIQLYMLIYMYYIVYFYILFHYRSLQDIDCISLCYTEGPWWLSILCICCYSVAKSCSTLCNPMDCSMPGFPVLHYLPEFAQILVHCVDDAILCHPLLLLPSVFPVSGSFPVIVFSHQVAKVLELQLQHQSFQWIFRVDFLWDWLVWSPSLKIQGTPKSLLQHHNTKASTLWCSAFFMVQVSNPCDY